MNIITYILVAFLIAWLALKFAGVVLTSSVFWGVLALIVILGLVNFFFNRRPRV